MIIFQNKQPAAVVSYTRQSERVHGWHAMPLESQLEGINLTPGS